VIVNDDWSISFLQFQTLGLLPFWRCHFWRAFGLENCTWDELKRMPWNGRKITAPSSIWQMRLRRWRWIKNKRRFHFNDFMFTTSLDPNGYCSCWGGNKDNYIFRLIKPSLDSIWVRRAPLPCRLGWRSSRNCEASHSISVTIIRAPPQGAELKYEWNKTTKSEKNRGILGKIGKYRGEIEEILTFGSVSNVDGKSGKMGKYL
jgi:hypothetical protein